ncbi:hypothetical protein [Leyella stercorea]|uniref:hypothetical protein n=1 Tax=Leyella stercorea TaxID=363265 RepID=UPI00266C6E47|nr:hypothetical protein [Leyella stercorea]
MRLLFYTYLNTSPSQHLTISPPHHLTISTPHHLTISTSQHLTTQILFCFSLKFTDFG